MNAAHYVAGRDARQVADVVDEKQAVGAAVSPDGKYMAWYQETGRVRKKEQQICIFTFESAGKQCYTMAEKAYMGYPYQLKWSPDSTQIAFSENPIQLGYESDIWVMNVADGTFTDLTQDDLTGSWQTFVSQGTQPNLDYLPAWNEKDGAIYFWRVVTTRQPAVQRQPAAHRGDRRAAHAGGRFDHNAAEADSLLLLSDGCLGRIVDNCA